MRSAVSNEAWLYIAIIALVCLIIAALPWMFIWALNTLFGLGIPFSIATYGAAAFLLVMSTAAVSFKS